MCRAFVFLDMRYVGQVVSAIAGMMMVEQLYETHRRNSAGVSNTSVLVSGMFMFDFYTFFRMRCCLKNQFGFVVRKGWDLCHNGSLAGYIGRTQSHLVVRNFCLPAGGFHTTTLSVPVYTCCSWHLPVTTSRYTAAPGSGAADNLFLRSLPDPGRDALLRADACPARRSFFNKHFSVTGTTIAKSGCA